jgi:Raf kinase inhibitor-like YbhB/YbcL family protein
MADKHLTFLLTLICAMGIFTGALFLAGKGIDITKIQFLNRQDGVTIVQTDPYPKQIKLSSIAFEHEGTIPDKYSCKGNDISPPLTISGVPNGTKSLVLIMDDPDAPYKTWVHWIVYNIDPRQNTIAENTIPWNAEVGQSDFGVDEYRGPCPPIGKHKYSLRIYALDAKIAVEKGPTLAKIEKLMDSHILDTYELLGYFEK